MTGTLPLNVLIHWKGLTQDFLSAGANSANLHRDLPYTDRVSSQTLCQKKKVFLAGPPPCPPAPLPPCPPSLPPPPPLCTALTGIHVRSSFTGLFFAIGMPVDAFFQSWEMPNCLVVPPVGIFFQGAQLHQFTKCFGHPGGLCVAFCYFLAIAMATLCYDN